MKQREQRRKVMIRARIRSGASWHDACILNLSTRGLMLQTASPPPRGVYLEVRRGRHVIVARVVWSKQHRVGLRSQDVLAVEAIIAEPDAGAAAADAGIAPATVERRARTRPRDRPSDHSRLRGRAFEFLCLAMLGVSACLLALGAVEQLFARPLSAAEAALARH